MGLDRSDVRARLSVALLFVAALGVDTGASAGVFTVRAGDSLSRLATAELGSGRAWPAILLATNGRVADPALGLVTLRDPNDLEVGQKVWIPDPAEAARLLRQWRSYELAVLDMSLPEPWEIERDLVVATGREATVVTWAEADRYEPPYPDRAAGDIWVTLEPHLQEFCRRAGTGEALVERLEQRLGLPPKSNKTKFVRIEVDPSAAGFFRPCSDPSVDRVGCELPDGEISEAGGRTWYPFWFYKQYHEAYGTARPARYPWTSLGYTFDWGQQNERGESEFVIRAETPIRILESVPTETYCAAGGAQ